jgi:dipeptidyl aminopeptidase/acylaminoacyl peptidase
VKSKHVLVLLLACAVVACSSRRLEEAVDRRIDRPADLSADRYVAVPETIENDGVPPIPIEIMETLQRYADVKSTSFNTWAPAGAGMLVATRSGNTNQIFRLEAPMGELRQLTDFDEPVSQAVFCPDPAKGYFVFVKDVGGRENYQLFRYDMATGESTMITDGTSRNMLGLMGGEEVFDTGGNRMAFASNRRTGMLFDIWVMDPRDPATARQIFEAQRPAYYTPVRWFADEERLLVLEYISANEVNTIIVDTVSGGSRRIDPKCGGKCVFVVFLTSTDGATGYGVSDRSGEFRKLVKVDLDTGKILPIPLKVEWDVDYGTGTADGGRAAFVVNEGGIGRLYLMDVDKEIFEPVDSVPMAQISGLQFSAGGDKLAMTLNGPRMNGDVYVLDVATGNLDRWTESDTAGLDASSFVEPELIHYPTFDTVDGKPRKIPAFYFRPAGGDGPYPAIISIHGGPEGQYRPTFNALSNFRLHEMGIAMLAPNVRGSSGYGKSYLLLDNAEKREDSVRDIGALLDWIATRPELDSDRVAVIGGSYGGYMVLASMVHYSDRLACGVDVVGISNFVTFLESTKAYRRDLRRAEYGDEREIGEFLESISPTTNAHKITIPLFVIQGKNDPRVPWTESQQIMETVRANGVPVWYLMAVNEGHGFAKKDNSDFMYAAIVKFFQEYLL